MGDQWPIFLYANYTYDVQDPWNGLLHSGILISVSRIFFVQILIDRALTGLQTYLYFSQFR
jgi:hypothetical protein